MRFCSRKVCQVFMLLICLMALSETVSASTFGTVRYVEVIAAHPRMLKFDFTVNRFADGPSAQIPIEQLQTKGRELEARLQELNSRVSAGVADLEKSLADSPKAKQAAEKDFWAQKEQIDSELEGVRAEIAANIAAMEFGGRTIETLVLPEINQIMTDVNAAVNNAARARGCVMVLSEPAPLPYEVTADDWIEEAYSKHLRQGNPADPQLIKRWVSSANRITPRLGAQVNLLRPVITSSVDITADAIKLLTRPAHKGGASRK